MKQNFYSIIASVMVSATANAATAETYSVWEGMYVEAGSQYVFHEYLERGVTYEVDLYGWDENGDLDFEVHGQNQFGQITKIVERKSNHNFEFVRFTAPYSGYFNFLIENWNKPSAQYYDFAIMEVVWH